MPKRNIARSTSAKSARSSVACCGVARSHATTEPNREFSSKSPLPDIVKYFHQKQKAWDGKSTHTQLEIHYGPKGVSSLVSPLISTGIEHRISSFSYLHDTARGTDKDDRSMSMNG